MLLVQPVKFWSSDHQPPISQGQLQYISPLLDFYEWHVLFLGIEFQLNNANYLRVKSQTIKLIQSLANSSSSSILDEHFSLYLLFSVRWSTLEPLTYIAIPYKHDHYITLWKGNFYSEVLQFFFSLYILLQFPPLSKYSIWLPSI